MCESVVEGDQHPHREGTSRAQLILREVQMGNVAVLLHHIGNSHTPFYPQAVVTEVKVRYRGVGLRRKETKR